jgi:hypothetical protein
MQHRSSRGTKPTNSGIVSIDTLENRTLFSGGEPGVLAPAFPEIIGEPIVIGTHSLIDITFTADNGRKTTISVKGAQAAITFSGTSVPLLANRHGYFPHGAVEVVQSILLTDAVPGKASLSEVCAYSPTPTPFNVGSITGGDLGSIKFPDVNLTGSLGVTSVGRVTLDDVSGAAITVSKSLSAMTVTGNMTGSLTAGSIGSLNAAELLQENVTTTAAFSRSALQIGSVTAKTGIQQSNIISAGNIGSVTAGYIQNSVITAAAHLTANTAGTFPSELVPESSSAFTSAASIRSIKVLPSITTDFFSNSVIAAKTIQNANIGMITGGGGLAAHAFGGVSAVGPTGELDSITLHLGPKDLRTSTTLRAALTRLGVPYTEGAGLQDNTMFYDFDLNVLR